MKNFTFSLAFLLVAFVSIKVTAQSWLEQHANGLPNSVNPLMTLSAVDPNICWGVNSENSQFIRTTDGGTTWTVDTITGVTGLNGTCISALDANIAFVAMNDVSGTSSGGVFKTTDGGLTWFKQNTAFPNSGGHPCDIHFLDSNNGVVIGQPHNGNWEIYTTSDGGVLWIQVPPENIPPPTIEWTGNGLYASAGNSIWFGTEGPFPSSHKIYKSTDKGLTWSAIQMLHGFSVSFKDSLNGLACNYYHYDQFNILVRTTDSGITWSLLQSVPSTPIMQFITYIKRTPGSYVITSSNNRGLPDSTFQGSLYSNDDGLVWTQIDNLPHGPASFANDGSGWSGGLNDIIYKWIPPTVPVELISFNSSVVGNSIQLTWQTATEINNQGFEIYRNGNKIAFVEGRGTTTETQDYSFVDQNLQSGIYNYRLNQIDFDGTQEVVGELTVYLSLPEEFSLEQNYPNPFNPSTIIKFTIPVTLSGVEGSFVTLKVYDVLGNEVATLVNEEKPAGNYEVEFNGHSDESANGGQNLTSGVYFYQLRVGGPETSSGQGFVETKKMLILK